MTSRTPPAGKKASKPSPLSSGLKKNSPPGKKNLRISLPSSSSSRKRRPESDSSFETLEGKNTVTSSVFLDTDSISLYEDYYEDFTSFLNIIAKSEAKEPSNIKILQKKNTMKN